MADIKRLIAQLKKEVPSVANNPILDEIESAYDDEEQGENADEQDEAAAGTGDDYEGDEAPAPATKPAAKKSRMPFM
jgi:hypothetical protein